MFCSAAVLRVLRAAEYPGTKDLDPYAETPEDLLEFMRASCASAQNSAPPVGGPAVVSKRAQSESASAPG
jgi:hypothetical protein